MNYLFGNPKKQKMLNDIKSNNFYLNIISGKKYRGKDFSKIYSNLKENKKNSPKYKTLKNSRNNIII